MVMMMMMKGGGGGGGGNGRTADDIEEKIVCVWFVSCYCCMQIYVWTVFQMF